MAQAEKSQQKKSFNPLIWVSLAVAGLILVIFLMSNRGSTQRKVISLDAQPQVADTAGQADAAAKNDFGAIERDAPAAPGQRARHFIKQLRDKGEPYPFDELMTSASAFAAEGSLADAHLSYFFAAREGYVPAMMKMAELNDPTLFRPENNLLDRPDAIQAYKWYRRALDTGFEPAQPRLQNLRQWAEAEARFGNADARQLLLNFK